MTVLVQCVNTHMNARTRAHTHICVDIFLGRKSACFIEEGYQHTTVMVKEHLGGPSEVTTKRA